MGRLRTFIAVELEPATRSRCVALQEALGRASTSVKWVEPENLHITLLFLGEVNAREAPAICQAVGRASRAIKPFPITLAGAGA